MHVFEGSHKTNKSLYKTSLTTQGESNSIFFPPVGHPRIPGIKRKRRNSSSFQDVLFKCGYQTVLI